MEIQQRRNECYYRKTYDVAGEIWFLNRTAHNLSFLVYRQLN